MTDYPVTPLTPQQAKRATRWTLGIIASLFPLVTLVGNLVAH